MWTKALLATLGAILCFLAGTLVHLPERRLPDRWLDQAVVDAARRTVSDGAGPLAFVTVDVFERARSLLGHVELGAVAALEHAETHLGTFLARIATAPPESVPPLLPLD